MNKYILALDQGTTSSRAVIFDKNGLLVNSSQKQLTQIYPKPGWIEHDPMEIWGGQIGVIGEVVATSGISIYDVESIGITNQRETTIIWDKTSGKPIYNAIGWQCRRTLEYCEELKSLGFENVIKEKTGLVIDAYFSATKIKWILDNVPGARDKAERGELLFGTVDTWLIWNLTKGKVHATDYTNASRTMLFNISKLDWDDQLLELFNIPKSLLPEIKPSSYIYGNTDPTVSLLHEIPIGGVAGDQQSALFGQLCFEEGSIKNTYGTGGFLLMNTGTRCISSKNGLLTTIAIGVNNEINYALEGSVFVAGAAIQWLRDELRLIYTADESEYYANLVSDTEGVYVVPAFTGLGAPYWDMGARGSVFGITRGTKREHIVRATLEAIAYQVKDVINAMMEDSKAEVQSLKVDGGASNNDFLMQFQSDILNIEVERPNCVETTALGAAFLAGLAVGFWKDAEELKKIREKSKLFVSKMSNIEREKKYTGWKRAVAASMEWSKYDI